MKVILQQDIPDVGRKYEVKSVADGYALNFLIPKKLALFAAAPLVAKAAKDQFVREQTLRTETLELTAAVKGLNNKKLTVEVKASRAGGLFAGLTADAVVSAINKEFKVSLEEENIELEKPIKETGEYEIPVSVGETHAKILLTVAAI